MAEPIRSVEGGVEVDVLVVPNARRSEIIGLHGDRVKVRIASPPEKGKANAAVLGLLEETLKVKRCQVMAGRTTRFKTVFIPRVDLETARKHLVDPRKGRSPY